MNWEVPAQSRAIASWSRPTAASPADQTVTVIAWLVRPGDAVREGQRIAEVESDKSVLDVSSSVAGTVDAILVEEGDPVAVGTALALITPHGDGVVRRSLIREEPGAASTRQAGFAGAGKPNCRVSRNRRLAKWGCRGRTAQPDRAIFGIRISFSCFRGGRRKRSPGVSASTAATGLPRMNPCSRSPSRRRADALRARRAVDRRYRSDRLQHQHADLHRALAGLLDPACPRRWSRARSAGGVRPHRGLHRLSLRPCCRIRFPAEPAQRTGDGGGCRSDVAHHRPGRLLLDNALRRRGCGDLPARPRPRSRSLGAAQATRDRRGARKAKPSGSSCRASAASSWTDGPPSSEAVPRMVEALHRACTEAGIRPD